LRSSRSALGVRKWLNRRDLVLVSRLFTSWNEIAGWLRQLDRLVVGI
jgi:hypothetical protein